MDPNVAFSYKNNRKTISSNMKTSPSLALEAYTRLRTIVSSLQAAQVLADGAATHLVDHAEHLAAASREEMRREYSARLQSSLDKMKWPGRQLAPEDDIIVEWTEAVERLLDLQKPSVSESYESMVLVFTFY
jgi:RAD50-interacting protein 1